MDDPFVIEFVYDASIEKVWSALTEKDAMKEWYFGALLNFEPVVGFKFEFTNDGSQYQKEWTVTNVVAGRMLSHTWTYKGYHGNSEVKFEIFEEGNKTRLKLTHTGLESFPDDSHFARERFEAGWKQILGVNLKSYLGREHR